MDEGGLAGQARWLVTELLALLDLIGWSMMMMTKMRKKITRKTMRWRDGSRRKGSRRCRPCPLVEA
jgi:hypothetical protein